jgi:hypothetical protein
MRLTLTTHPLVLEHLLVEERLLAAEHPLVLEHLLEPGLRSKQACLLAVALSFLSKFHPDSLDLSAQLYPKDDCRE